MLRPIACRHTVALTRWLKHHFATCVKDEVLHTNDIILKRSAISSSSTSFPASSSSSSTVLASLSSKHRSQRSDNLIENPHTTKLASVFAESRFQDAEDGVIGDKKWISDGGFPADLTSPHKQYPLARKMRRRIIYHAGPTNSGKTRAALQALTNAVNGVYAAPLRLLAWEIYEKLNSEGTPCNLLTGQESEVGLGQHVSCTVEMADTELVYDVAVLDEIQMIGDSDRGWAWTRALLGLAAKEVHVCGDESVEGLVRAMCKQCGDLFEIHHYKRLLPLKIGPSLSSMKWQARPGDCFVGFSRKDLYGIRHDLEKARGDLEISLVYGSLPPETRRKQASQFNGPEKPGKHKVLVASDAIGMGLNLNIGRIVFTTLEKFDGQEMRLLTRREVKQIAGRAGRFGKGHDCGEVVCMDEDDTDFVRGHLDSSLEPITRAGIFPSAEQLQAFHDLPPDPMLQKRKKAFEPGFAGTIERFMYAAVLSNLYALCQSEQMLEIAKLLDRVPELTMKERHTYCMAPVPTRIAECMGQLLRFAKAHVKGEVGLSFVPAVPQFRLQYQSDLLTLETCHKTLDMYQWLARRFPKIYCLEQTEAIVQQRQAEVCERLEKGLLRSALSWKRRVRQK